MTKKMISIMTLIAFAFLFTFGAPASQADASSTTVIATLSSGTLTIHGTPGAYVYVKLEKKASDGDYTTMRAVTYKLDSRGYYYIDAAEYSFAGYSITSGSYRYYVSQDQPYYSTDTVLFTK